MWLVTRMGFYSVVYKPEDGPRLTIRARVRADLVALKENYLPRMSRIVERDESDYRFRAFATRQQVARAVAKIASEIDYQNFKTEVMLQQGSVRAAIYHRVWEELLDLQPIRRPFDGYLRQDWLQEDR